MKKKLPKSLKKYIRKEKARIRRDFLNIEEQKEAISEIYSQLVNKDNLTENKKLVKKTKKEEKPSSSDVIKKNSKTKNKK